MPIEVIAAESIERAWKRLLRHGRRIDDASPAEDLHRVRIDGKKLRYLAETFRSVFQKVDLGPVIAGLKDLQDCLGAINDAAVQEEALRRLASRLDRDPGSGPSGESAATLVSIGRLIERGSAQSAAARRRFDERFEDLRSKENRKRIKALVE
jgi:CHAD domain-containing protein